MSPWRRGAVTLCLMAVATAAGGCWNRREVETLAFVMAAGIDRTPDGRVELTAQVAIPSQLAGAAGTGGAGGGGGVAARRAFWTISSTGETVFDAERNFLSQSSRRLNWSHMEVIVLSEAYARGGVRDALDFFDRDAEPRRTAWVTVARGTPIRELLAAEFPLERLGGVAVNEMIMVGRAGLAKTRQANLNEFLRALSAEGIEPLATGLMLAAPEAGAAAEEQQDLLKQHLRALGNAVFRGDRMIGWLDEREARGLMFLQGEVVGTVLVVPCPGEEERRLSVEVLRSQAAVQPEVRGEAIRMKIRVEIEGNVGQMDCTVGKPDPGWFRAVGSMAASEVRRDIERSLDRLQEELRVDAMGFGLALYRKHPQVWRQVRDRWDQLLPRIPVAVEAEASIRRTGLTARPIPVR